MHLQSYNSSVCSAQWCCWAPYTTSRAATSVWTLIGETRPVVQQSIQRAYWYWESGSLWLNNVVMSSEKTMLFLHGSFAADDGVGSGLKHYITKESLECAIHGICSLSLTCTAREGQQVSKDSCKEPNSTAPCVPGCNATLGARKIIPFISDLLLHIGAGYPSQKANFQAANQSAAPAADWITT